jgi:hypothetical protein
VANEEGAFREVDQAVAEERQQQFLKKNGPLLLGCAAATLLAVGGWQIWTGQKAKAAGRAALEFSTATEILAKTPEDGIAALGAMAENAPAGYSVLADLRRAGALLNAGDRVGALAAYRDVYANSRAPKGMRDLARIKAAMISMADGREAVLADLGDLADRDSSFAAFARELAAVAAFEAKDYENALALFQRAANDPKTPEQIRVRAEEMAALAAAGKSGVNLTGEARLEDLEHALDLQGYAPEEATDAPAEEAAADESPPEGDNGSNEG